MTTWHAPPDVLTRFALEPEALDDVTASSVEQHLVACETCRAAVSSATPASELEASWAAIAEVIDRPRTTMSERLLARVGMPNDLARVVGATPGLRLAWLGTIAFLALGAVQVARQRDTEVLFLVIAPLLPLVSVVLAFLPAEEPGGEAAAATPLYGAGVVIRRAAAALVPTFLILASASLALPHVAEGARWLLPGLALSVGSLALATYLRPLLAVASLAVGWIGILIAVRVLEARRIPLDRTVVFELRGQLVALTVTLLAAALLYVRRDRFSTVEVSW
ncbi:MAG: zf-HC2 domain-containing protein [Acidimicrobiales bacterium]